MNTICGQPEVSTGRAGDRDEGLDLLHRPDS